jgi:hypothetical protein
MSAPKIAQLMQRQNFHSRFSTWPYIIENEMKYVIMVPAQPATYIRNWIIRFPTQFTSGQFWLSWILGLDYLPILMKHIYVDPTRCGELNNTHLGPTDPFFAQFAHFRRFWWNAYIRSLLSESNPTIPILGPLTLFCPTCPPCPILSHGNLT